MSREKAAGMGTAPASSAPEQFSAVQSSPDRDAAGRDAEIVRLYRSERGRLLRLALLLVGDRSTAEDVVQDAFASLHTRWPTLTEHDRAAGYLSVCVTNAARSVLRRRGTAMRWLALSRVEHTDPADEPVLLAAEHEQLVAAVRRLPKRQQQVVALRYWGGLSETQIARALGVSKGTVKSSAARALARLQKHLEKPDE